jgi:hypothetical protein
MLATTLLLQLLYKHLKVGYGTHSALNPGTCFSAVLLLLLLLFAYSYQVPS